jgi:hypothetical protein
MSTFYACDFVVGCLQVEKNLSKNLARAMVHDIAIGKGGLRCGGKLKKAAQKHAGRIKSELVMLKIKSKARETSDLLPAALREEVVHPRYARVNLLKRSMDQMVAELVSGGRSGTVEDAMSTHSWFEGVCVVRVFACSLWLTYC